MRAMAKQAGWNLVDVIKTPIHGTSYVFVLSPNHKRPKHIKNLIAMESALQDPATYEKWADDVAAIKDALVEHCAEYQDLGFKLVGYGAAAKGMTLLNYTKLKLDCIIDDNPLKQNTYSPGMDIPVVGSDVLNNYTDDDKILFIPLAWNFFKEIREKIKTKRNCMDDRFLRYFPEVAIEY
jgi:hypothetical protein